MRQDEPTRSVRIVRKRTSSMTQSKSLAPAKGAWTARRRERKPGKNREGRNVSLFDLSFFHRLSASLVCRSLAVLHAILGIFRPGIGLEMFRGSLFDRLNNRPQQADPDRVARGRTCRPTRPRTSRRAVELYAACSVSTGAASGASRGVYDKRSSLKNKGRAIAGCSRNIV